MTERRQAHRVKVCGSAVLRARGVVARCRIVDLSTGGVELVPEGEHGDVASLDGIHVDVDIHLDSRQGEWIHERGVVRHVDADTRHVGIAFTSVSAAMEDLVQSEALSEVDAERTIRVIVVDVDTTRRARLAAALRRAGAAPIEVATPLEAIQAIEQSSAHVAIAAVAELLTQTDGETLMRYVSASHPGIQLAVINGHDDRPGAVLHVVADDDAYLDEQVARLLGTWREAHQT